MSLNPASHGSRRLGVPTVSTGWHDLARVVEAKALPVHDLELHLVDVDRVRVGGGVVQPQTSVEPSAGFSVIGYATSSA